MSLVRSARKNEFAARICRFQSVTLQAQTGTLSGGCEWRTDAGVLTEKGLSDRHLGPFLLSPSFVWVTEGQILRLTPKEDLGGGRRQHPRYVLMRLLSDAVACAANAGKIAVFAGNPLAFNYAQWLAFVRSAVSYARLHLRYPTDVLLAKATVNETVLSRNWDDLFDAVSTRVAPEKMRARHEE